MEGQGTLLSQPPWGDPTLSRRGDSRWATVSSPCPPRQWGLGRPRTVVLAGLALARPLGRPPPARPLKPLEA